MGVLGRRVWLTNELVQLLGEVNTSKLDDTDRQLFGHVRRLFQNAPPSWNPTEAERAGPSRRDLDLELLTLRVDRARVKLDLLRTMLERECSETQRIKMQNQPWIGVHVGGAGT